MKAVRRPESYTAAQLLYGTHIRYNGVKPTEKKTKKNDLYLSKLTSETF